MINRTTVSIFFAQAMAHVLWYVSARAAVLQHVATAVGMDAAYGVLTVYTYQNVVSRDAPRRNVMAYLLGGALGTALGVSVPV